MVLSIIIRDSGGNCGRKLCSNHLMKCCVFTSYHNNPLSHKWRPTFTDLGTTVYIENVDIKPLIHLFNINVDTLGGLSEDVAVKVAVDRLITV